MHYIRLLKTPRVHVDHGIVTLRSTLTVTTDLGETFYPEDVELVATLRSPDNDGDIYLRRKVQWHAGDRAVNVSFDISRSDVEWPACLHVGLKQAGRGAGSLGSEDGFLPPVVDVWSGTLDPTRGDFDAGRRVERRFTTLAERTVSLYEDAGDSIARHVWDGSLALAQHIDEVINLQAITSALPLLEYTLVSATYRRLTVLELGCGVGTVGLSLAQSIPGCDVLLTDLPEARELANLNIARLKPAMGSKVSFAPLDWHNPLPPVAASRSTDLIVVSECTYNTSTLRPLVGTLVSLVNQRPKAVIVVSTKTRHPSEAQFFDLMKGAGFTQDCAVRVRLPGRPGTGYADTADDVGLHVFHGSQHRLSLSPRERSEEEVPKTKGRRSPVVRRAASQ